MPTVIHYTSRAGFAVKLCLDDKSQAGLFGVALADAKNVAKNAQTLAADVAVARRAWLASLGLADVSKIQHGTLSTAVQDVPAGSVVAVWVDDSVAHLHTMLPVAPPAPALALVPEPSPLTADAPAGQDVDTARPDVDLARVAKTSAELAAPVAADAPPTVVDAVVKP